MALSAAMTSVYLSLTIAHYQCTTHALHMQALRRAKFKFPGRQKILRSEKWGLTKWSREDYARGRQEGWLMHAGNGVKYISQHGRLGARKG
jgi:large subunit ribosomal protein L10e